MPCHSRRKQAPTFFVPLDRVVVSARRQRGVCRQAVEHYRGLLEDGREAPPVRLARQGECYLVRDGRHRVAAARAAGFTLIEAEVV